MANYKNIEDYRTKKKRKNILKRIIFFVIILCILVALLNVLQLFKGRSLNNIISQNSNNKTELFPIIVKNEQLLDLYNIGSDFSLLSKSRLTTYEENGKKIVSKDHGYTNPVIREGNKRLLTYDRGGSRIRLDSSTKLLEEKTLNNQIQYAQICSNGNVVVVTNHNRFASVITVYDSNLNEIYQYSSAENILFVCFSPNQHYLLATTITITDNVISTQLVELSISDESDINTYTVKNILPLDVSYSDNNKVTIIGKDKLVTYDTKSKNNITYEYKGDLVSFINSSEKQSVLATRNLVDNGITIEVINANGKSDASYDIDDEVLDLYSDGSRILVLGKYSAYNFDMSLLLLNKYKLETNYSKISYNGDKLYIMSTDSVQNYKMD